MASFEPSQATQIAGQERASPDGAEHDDEDARPPDAPWARLVQFQPARRYDLRGDEPLVIGRHANSTIAVQHPQVSNKHCNVRRKALLKTFSCFIEDTSSNGTFVNGRRLHKNTPLELPHKALVTLVSSRPKPEQLAFSFVFYDLMTGSETANESPQGTDVIGAFFITDEVLGNGSFAQVKLAYSMTNGAQVAVKIVSKRRFKDEAKTKSNLLQEITMLQQINHPGVIRVYDVEDTVHCVYIFLEHAPDGDLFQYIKRNGPMAEQTAKVYFKQMLLAVQFLHSQGIIHRDLKLENVVLLPSKPYHLVKLTDFGLAKLIGETPFVRTICGTPNYIAPEVLAARPYDQRVDCWSLGVILYTMLTAAMPFDEKEEALLYRKILNAQFEFRPDIWVKMDGRAKELVRGLITVDPSKRMQVDQALSHPWLSEDDEVAQLVREIMESQPPMPEAPAGEADGASDGSSAAGTLLSTTKRKRLAAELDGTDKGLERAASPR